jgi:ABC-2 type transport system permease protein
VRVSGWQSQPVLLRKTASFLFFFRLSLRPSRLRVAYLAYAVQKIYMKIPSTTSFPLRLTPRPKYWSVAVMAMQQAIAYRARTAMTLLANLIWVVMSYYLWQTIYAGATSIQGFDWAQMRSYILLSYAVNMLLSFYSAGQMMAPIRTGEIAQDLLRPLDYLNSQLARATGTAIIEGGLSALATLILGIFAFGILPPVSPLALLLFIVSIAIGFLIKFLVTFLTTLLCFWTVNSLGLIWTYSAIINLFSGTLIPLAFFPDWLHTLTLWLPFQGIIYTPVMIYLGQYQGLAAFQALAVQAGWVVALWLAARAFWGVAIRALDIQGG